MADPSIRLSQSESQAKAPTIEDFDFIKPISRGAFGKVFLGKKHGKKEQVYAIKVMKKADMINKNLTSQVITERDAMAKVSSPFVVNLFYSIQSQQNIFLVMEYLIGGDVKSLLGVAGYFDEHMAITYIAEVTLALDYLHSKNIIHRDLKPDNMLLTNKGHIKLTDFGLSKFNMSFNACDHVPMTPKTPMPYFHRDYDLYRTPGQILSLRSSLAFSSEDHDGSYMDVTDNDTDTTPHSTAHVSPSKHVPTPTPHSSTHAISRRHTPVYAQTSISATPKLPSTQKPIKHKSMTMREMLLSQSTSDYFNKHIKQVSTPDDTDSSTLRKGPVTNLMSSLHASMEQRQSTGTDFDLSSVRGSDVSSIPDTTRPIGMSLSCFDDLPQGSIASDYSLASQASMESHTSDNVFEYTDNTAGDGQTVNDGRTVDGGHTDKDDMEGVTTASVADESGKMGECFTCHKKTTRERNCSECQSHLKMPCRQEKITDDTPQMHRTEESVRNSYAAKNLRSLRYGSYSEDSDGDSSGKENMDVREITEILQDKPCRTQSGGMTKTAHGTESREVFKPFNVTENAGNWTDRNDIKQSGDVLKPYNESKDILDIVRDAKANCDMLKLKTNNSFNTYVPRKLVKSDSFCYVSDEEEINTEIPRFRQRYQFARKRGITDVEMSPIGRSQSVGSGLTQDFLVLRCKNGEPLTKRSSSLPRTRIQFNNQEKRNDLCIPVELKMGSAKADSTHTLPAVDHSVQTEHQLKHENNPLSALDGNCNTVNRQQHLLNNNAISLPSVDSTKMIGKCRNLSASDNLVCLSEDEQRLAEGHSDTSSMSGSEVTRLDTSTHTELADSELTHSDGTSTLDSTNSNSVLHDNPAQDDNGTNTETANGNIHTKFRFDFVDNVSMNNDADAKLFSSLSSRPLVDKRLAGLQKPMASSLNSEGEIRDISLNLSSIHDNESSATMAMDVSVFTNSDSDVSCKEEVEPSHRSPVVEKKDSAVLLPPPPPRVKRPSGRKTPAKITFCSAATIMPPTYIPHESRRRSHSGQTPILMTPEPALRNQARTVIHAPSPKTPFQNPCRSQSMSCALKTPYRTPKSVRRAPAPPEEDRILGTPDYLAPEILQQKTHGVGVDWWSLGICMFEFLTGVPPFNDQTPELVFQNILNRDIPWPEEEDAISVESRAAIEALLTMEPNKRPKARDIRKMQAFSGIGWSSLLEQPAPWVPEPDNDMDTTYFEARNTMQELFVSDVDF